MNKFYILLLICSQFAFSQENPTEISYIDELDLLIYDLANSNTNGYKSHMLEIDYDNLTAEDILNELHIPRGTRRINFSQGSLHYTNRDFDFAILGNGFFKIVLYDGTVAFTRNGEFMIDSRTNEFVLIDGRFSSIENTRKNELIMINGGYRLYDTINIIPGYTQILFNTDHSIIAVYPNGDEINVGRLNIYTLDTNELRYFDNTFESSNIFIYNGDEDFIYNGRIEHKVIELSNVQKIVTIIRLFQISRILGMELIFDNE